MPAFTIEVPAESFLVYRGIRVYHVYRGDVFPERYEFIFSLSPTEESSALQFDVRELPGGEEPGADPATVIRAALDRVLDANELFPYHIGPGPLPDPATNAPHQDLPDDWDLLDLLGVVGARTQPVSRSLDERQLLGLVQLVTLAGHLSPEQSQTVERWLRG